MVVLADAKVLIFAVDLCLINFLPLPLYYPRKYLFGRMDNVGILCEVANDLYPSCYDAN